MGAWKIRTLSAVQVMDAWLVKFRREMYEPFKDSPASVAYAETLGSGQLELKNQL